MSRVFVLPRMTNADDISQVSDVVEAATQVLAHGGIILYPTETVYGLGCDPFSKEAVKKIQHIKQRPDSRALSIAVSSLECLDGLAKITPLANELSKQFLPGPLTLVLEKGPECPSTVAPPKTTVGIRVPDNAFTMALLESFGPLVSTSANVHGSPPITGKGAETKPFGNDVDIYIWDQKITMGKPSTVVDATGEKCIILREGIIKKEELRN